MDWRKALGASLTDFGRALFEQGDMNVKCAVRQNDSEMIYMAVLYRIEHGIAPVFTILTRASVENSMFVHNSVRIIMPATAIGDC